MLALVSAALSNIVSNVPTVLVLQPYVAALAHPGRAWLVLGVASALPAPLTIIGPVAHSLGPGPPPRTPSELDSCLSCARHRAVLARPSLDFGPKPSAEAEPRGLAEHVHPGEAIVPRARPWVEPGAGMSDHAIARESAENEVPGIGGAGRDLRLDLRDRSDLM